MAGCGRLRSALKTCLDCSTPGARLRLLASRATCASKHNMFLIGLITGLVEPHFANVRMGLAAHLEGLMNGMLLVVLGAIWTEVKLTPRVGLCADDTYLLAAGCAETTAMAISKVKRSAGAPNGT